MANDDLESFLRRAGNYRGGAPEYYEDTHDENGNYRGPSVSSGYGMPSYTPPPSSQQFGYGTPREDLIKQTEAALGNPPKISHIGQTEKPQPKAVPLPNAGDFVSPRLYQNIVLYSPQTANDVERLIDYLRRREPAIVDLDPISESPDAQRVLDFTSGAVYALNGRIIEIKTNTFLIVPEGVDVAKPEDH